MDRQFTSVELQKFRAARARLWAETHSARSAAASIIAAHAEHPELIAVDLSEVLFMDPAGLRTLEEGARHLGDGGVRFAVICPSSHGSARLPQLAGLHGVLNVHESMDAAMEPWLDEAGETLAGA